MYIFTTSARKHHHCYITCHTLSSMSLDSLRYATKKLVSICMGMAHMQEVDSDLRT